MDEAEQCKYIITLDGKLYKESLFISLREFDLEFVTYENVTDFEGECEDTLGVNFGNKKFDVQLRYYTNKEKEQYVTLPILFMRDSAVIDAGSTNQEFEEKMNKRTVVLHFIDSIIKDGVVGFNEETKKVKTIIENGGNYTFSLNVLMEKLNKLNKESYYIERTKYLTLRGNVNSITSDLGNNEINEGPIKQ